MLVFTFLLYGGLNQMMFLFRCFLLLAVSIFAWYLSLCLYTKTELSNAIWWMKKLGHHPKVEWEIVKKCIPYNQQTTHCLLCLNEKLEIATHKEHNILNKTIYIIYIIEL